MASSTNIEASKLLESLESADGPVAWPVGKIVNALLEKAKAEEPDNPVLGAIDPLRPGQGNSYISGMKASDVRVIVGQIVASTNSAPSIA
jgi:hypothetical protein